MSENYMGTIDEAKADFLAKVDRYIELRQPSMATAKEHRKREMSEHEARFQLCNAATHLAWHMRNGP